MRIIAPLIAVLALIACKPKDAAAPEPVTAASAAEADAFGRSIATALSGCDADAVAKLIDLDSLARRAARGRNASPEIRAAFVAGMRRSAIGQSLCTSLGQGAQATWLRSRDRGHGPAPLLRVLTGAAVAYLEFEIGRTRGATDVRAVDVVNYATGMSASETAGRLLDSMMANGGPRAGKRDLEGLQAARAKLNEGDAAGARAAFDSLPPAFRAERSVRSLDIEISMSEGDAAYQATLERFERDYPDDPALLLQAVDLYYMRKDFVQVLTRIDRLDQAVGGDPYLDVLRCGPLNELGRPHDALAAARRATMAEPDLTPAWSALTLAQVANGDHAGAARSLDRLVELGDDVELDPADPTWTGFAASPEGQAWLAAHR